MESTLHRQLKERFGPLAGGTLEVTLEGFRIDAVAADGALLEVQSGPLGPLRTKLRRLLPGHLVRVVKPVVVARHLIQRVRRDGVESATRLSPKRGTLADVFEDMVGLATLFPHPNLGVDVLAVEIDEVRLVRRRRPGFSVLDRRLRAVVASVALRQGRDLWALLPDNLPDPFTTRDLAERLQRPLALAQRVAYCLHLAGAVTLVSKQGNRRVYAITDHQRGLGIGQGLGDALCPLGPIGR